MKKENDNLEKLSCTNPHQDHHTEYGRELSKLHAELKAKELRSQQTHKLFRVELQILREEAERDLHTAVLEYMSRRLHQTGRTLNKTRQREKVHFTGFGHNRTVTYTWLDKQLKIYDKVNTGTPPGVPGDLQHRQKLDLEKALLLCHQLKTHNKGQGQASAGEKNNRFFKTQDINQTRRQLTYSTTSVKTTEHYFKSIKKRREQKLPSRWALCAAGHCSTTTERDTCPSNSQKVCHPPDTPHVDWKNSASYSTESSRDTFECASIRQFTVTEMKKLYSDIPEPLERRRRTTSV
ncbi:hypothetical protein WMY93_007976 [Mugilogobius chulae]|uniref:Uncharacterized protein n=1 Tax=Mugilogobius chulae TaxID=88201 RepID=A0AAW0PER6_9GOBI